MTVTAEHEDPRPPAGPGFSDAITFAWADPERDRFGVARIGLGGGLASGLAVLFADRAPVAVRAEGGVEVPEGAGWDAIAAGGVSTAVLEPLRRWQVTFDGGQDGGFVLEAEALSEPAELDPEGPVARAGGMAGYEQLCRLRGEVRTSAGTVQVDCLGQRGRSWGEPDWDRITQARTVSAWAGPDLAASVVAIRGTKAKHGHGADAVAATLFVPDGPVDVDEARLSTTLDGEGRQRKASLELYEDPEAYPRRAAGQVICGTSLDLGRLQLDTAFFAWSFDGRPSVGRYDVLRRDG